MGDSLHGSQYAKTGALITASFFTSFLFLPAFHCLFGQPRLLDLVRRLFVITHILVLHLGCIINFDDLWVSAMGVHAKVGGNLCSSRCPRRRLQGKSCAEDSARSNLRFDNLRVSAMGLLL